MSHAAGTIGALSGQLSGAGGRHQTTAPWAQIVGYRPSEHRHLAGNHLALRLRPTYYRIIISNYHLVALGFTVLGGL